MKINNLIDVRLVNNVRFGETSPERALLDEY